MAVLGCRGTLLAAVCSVSCQDPQVLPSRSLNSGSSSPSLHTGITLGAALCHIDPHEGWTLVNLELVRVPLDGIRPFCCTIHTAQLSVTADRTQCQCLSLTKMLMSPEPKADPWDSAGSITPPGTEPLSTALWLQPSCSSYPWSSPPFSTSLQFRDEDAVGTTSEAQSCSSCFCTSVGTSIKCKR